MNKEPWVNYPDIWKSKSAFMSWLRGGIRRSLWSKSPIKLEFIKKNRKKIKNPKKTSRSKPEVWGATCCICGNDRVIANIEVDHKIGNHSLREIDDITTFIESIVLVTDDDLQLVCKECHKIKSHAERKGISFDEAAREKKVIAYMKLPTAELVALLEEHDMPCNNAKVRKCSLTDIIDELPML